LLGKEMAAGSFALRKRFIYKSLLLEAVSNGLYPTVQSYSLRLSFVTEWRASYGGLSAVLILGSYCVSFWKLQEISLVKLPEKALKQNW
jgi:hypothetical protein